MKSLNSQNIKYISSIEYINKLFDEIKEKKATIKILKK
mgnify:CR=1 FL=1